jgi:hypothetical protein
MANQWKPTAPKRDLTVYRGEDVDMTAILRTLSDGQPWTPPDGTTAFWTIVDPNDFTVLATWTGVVIDNTVSMHVEQADLAALLAPVADATSGPQIRFYVQTPETTNGNPHLVSIGTVKYV